MKKANSIPVVLENLSAYVEALIQTYHIPALSIAVYYDNRLYEAAGGVLNLNTGVAATTNSIFQIGSISKIFTACLIMQLVDEGKVELDKPVRHYLRGFQMLDQEHSETVTVAQLLDHTSGIPGDFIGSQSYTENNCLKRYVDRCRLLPSLHQPGKNFSYSNAAYNIAGRLIEVVMGMNWFDAIEGRIFKPLGMTHAVAHPSQVLKHRVAMGHVTDAQGGLTVSPDCYFPMEWAPCGAALTLSAGSLIDFAKAHLNGGKTEAGNQWLSSHAVELMQRHRVVLPPHAMMYVTDWALGWQLIARPEVRMVGHGGRTLGQSALLQMVPERNCAFAVLYNSDQDEPLSAIIKTFAAELAGVDLKDDQPIDQLVEYRNLQPLVGRYRSLDTIVDIAMDGGLLSLSVQNRDGLIQPRKFILKPIGEEHFACFSEDGRRTSDVSFLEPDNNGVPRYLNCLFRLIPRVQ